MTNHQEGLDGVAGKIFSLLTREEKWEFAGVIVAMFFMAVIEVMGIASIMPFMALVANPDSLTTSKYLIAIHQFVGIADPQQFLIFLGVGVLVFLLVSNLVSAFTMWLMLNFTNIKMHSLSTRLLVKYLSQPYVFFLNRNSSELLKNVISEVNRVVSGVLVPAVQAVARVVVMFFVIGFLFIVDPKLALAVFTVIGVAYALIYTVIRKQLSRIGSKLIIASNECYRFASEALGGVKDIKLAAREMAFVERYSVPSRQAARYEALAQAMALLPRYLLEVIAFGGIVVIVIYLLASRGDIGQVLPLVSLYALAGYRLLPAMQQLFWGISHMRFNLPALDQLMVDLGPATPGQKAALARPTSRLAFSREIRLANLEFSYPNSKLVTLPGLNLTVKANTTVGLVGMTGAGKTTIADIVLGLLQPDEGTISVDGVPVTPQNVRQWQANLGYVPQTIYLSDDTVANNIAFGVPESQIDMAAIERAARAANLHDFVASNLAEGYRTLVGDRGIRLSGGQRQRIAIARALYLNPSVLVLDEATSALDGVTENIVMEAIATLAKQRTIIVIAHRVTTLKDCDVIHVLDGGRVMASGSYQELLDSNQAFQALAQVA